jgi:hypothetical protein
VVFGDCGRLGRGEGTAPDPSHRAPPRLEDGTRTIRSSDVGARIDDDVGRRGEVGGRSRHHRPCSIGVDDVDGPVVKVHGTRHEGIREI